MKKEKLCLIGCGWLGKALAVDLLKRQYQVIVTTAHDKSDEFSKDGISYIQYDISSEDACPFTDVLIYTIPPLEFSIVKNFFDKISPNQKIIFTSSTSVYGKHLGDVDETTALDSTNTSSPLLLQTEEYLRARFKNITIIRPGGLYGDKRHPIFFLEGKRNLTTGEEYLHLAHQKDCIFAIEAILEKGIWGETINIVSDLRVPKKIYYTEMAEKRNLPPPHYEENFTKIAQTRISNEKSKSLLKIDYLDPNQF